MLIVVSVLEAIANNPAQARREVWLLAQWRLVGSVLEGLLREAHGESADAEPRRTGPDGGPAPDPARRPVRVVLVCAALLGLWMLALAMGWVPWLS